MLGGRVLVCIATARSWSKVLLDEHALGMDGGTRKHGIQSIHCLQPDSHKARVAAECPVIVQPDNEEVNKGYGSSKTSGKKTSTRASSVSQ